MSKSTATRPLWRVGHHAVPLEFTPLDIYAFNHRFDDTAELHRFRTMYFADFRPNLTARQRHIERYGPEAVDDIPTEPVTAKWRRENVLVSARLELEGELVDLFDPTAPRRSWHGTPGSARDYGQAPHRDPDHRGRSLRRGRSGCAVSVSPRWRHMHRMVRAPGHTVESWRRRCTDRPRTWRTYNSDGPVEVEDATHEVTTGYVR